MAMDKAALHAACVTLNTMLPRDAPLVEENIVKEAIAAYLQMEYGRNFFTKTVQCGRCGKTGESPFWHQCGNIEALAMIGNFDPGLLLAD
jgi:hypothetical protein